METDTRGRAPEQRTYDVDVTDLDTRGKRVVGYAAVYGAEAQLDGFVETIAQGAFAGVLSDDVRCLLNHDPNVVLGRTKSGTLKLADDQRGLRFEVELPESRQDLREAVRRGDIDGASFRFRVGDEEWDGDRRTITRVDELKDITLATYPAYPDTSIELRTRDAAREPQKEKDTMEQQEQQQEGRSEGRTEEAKPYAGSLHVEERAESQLISSLADLFEQRGFPASPAAVSWDEFRALTWSGGTVLDTLNPVRRAGVSLAYDERWAYPAFPSIAVDSSTTGVQVLRQQSRTLPAGTAVVRPLDSTSTKPEVTTVTELVSQQLSQVAAVSSNVPNIHGEQVPFQSMIETDLRLSISEGYDRLVLNGLALAGTLTAGTAGDIIQKTRRGVSQLATAGYAADTLIIDAAGAEQLDLLRSSGSEQFYIWNPGQPAGSVWGLNRRVTKAPGTAVVDAQAYGRLYASPLSLQRFEVDAGLTNRSNYRLEGHATFGVERLTAGVRII